MALRVRGPARPGVMVLAGVALLAGLWGGLARVGWSVPGTPAAAVASHGVLMAVGFLGTVISLERAVALRRAWGYLVPAATGLGAVGLLVLPSVAASQVLFAIGGAGLTAMAGAITRMQPTLHHAVGGLGALCWVGGAGRWLAGGSPGEVAPWWAAFLVITIAGERLELARMPGLETLGRRLFLAALTLIGAGIVMSVPAFEAGTRVAGAGLLGLAAWLARYDVARRTVRLAGLPRFSAVGLWAGYAWLAVAGALWLAGGLGSPGSLRDSATHAFFLGFVLSMVFAHAPIILPAVLGVPLGYHPRLYAHVALLHGSLVVRVVGDLASVPGAVRWGGLLNVIAALLFLPNTALTRAPSGGLGRG